MVQIMYREPPPPEPRGPTHDPYAMVEVIVGDHRVQARPYEFSGEIVADGLDANGQQVYPTKLSSSCPVCGHGLTVTIVGRHAFGACECGLQVTNDARVQDAAYMEEWRHARDQPVAVVAPVVDSTPFDPFRNPVLDGLLPVAAALAVPPPGHLTSIQAPLATVVPDSVTDLGPEPDDA